MPNASNVSFSGAVATFLMASGFLLTLESAAASSRPTAGARRRP